MMETETLLDRQNTKVIRLEELKDERARKTLAGESFDGNEEIRDLSDEIQAYFDAIEREKVLARQEALAVVRDEKEKARLQLPEVAEDWSEALRKVDLAMTEAVAAINLVLNKDRELKRLAAIAEPGCDVHMDVTQKLATRMAFRLSKVTGHPTGLGGASKKTVQWSSTGCFASQEDWVEQQLAALNRKLEKIGVPNG